MAILAPWSASLLQSSKVATPNILGDKPVLSALVTIASHNIAANSASLLTELGLGVKGSRRILGSDGIIVRLSVAGKAGGVEVVVAIGRQDTDNGAVSGCHAETMLSLRAGFALELMGLNSSLLVQTERHHQPIKLTHLHQFCSALRALIGHIYEACRSSIPYNEIIPTYATLFVCLGLVSITLS